MKPTPRDANDGHRSLLHGIIGQFATPDESLTAAEKARDAGTSRSSVHAIPVEGLAKPSDSGGRRALTTSIGGVGGGLTGFGLQYWCSAISYPINVAGAR